MKPLATHAAASSVPAGHDHEELVVQTGRRTGVTMAVAIHSTRLGPALGGVRLWRYLRDEDGVADALRLARGMTFKAAAAGLDLGGGKGVICARSIEPPASELRRAIFLDFGDLVDSLGGRYITAEDVGTSPEDMMVIAERTRHVTGRPQERGGTGDPSPFTALGVQAAMRAAARRAFGTPDLSGRRVVVAGLGHVGTNLARALSGAGAELAVTDIDPDRRKIARVLEVEWLEPEHALEADCDIVSPCAVGGAINEANIDRLKCRVICGAANNQLADEALADTLAERGIVYAPDFIANAGGLISVYREVHSYPVEKATALALGIEETMGQVFARADVGQTTPLEAARELAEERLGSTGEVRD